MDVPTGPKLTAQAQQSLRMQAQRQGHCSQVQDGLEPDFDTTRYMLPKGWRSGQLHGQG
jgi:hypothetical protein